MKRLSILFLVLIGATLLAAGIHMTVACLTLLRSMGSAPVWVGLLVGIPYLAAALLMGAVWLLLFLRHRHCKRNQNML